MSKATETWWSKGPVIILRGPFRTLWLKLFPEPVNSSSPQPPKPFIPFWEKEDSTGITKIKERLCDKHQLQSWMSNSKEYSSYVFICVKCGAAYRISVNEFVKNFTIPEETHEDQVHHWLGDLTGKEIHLHWFDGGSAGYFGRVGKHDGDSPPA